MKVVLLAGGFGSRISEESQFKPKPMIEIGGMPIMVIPSLSFVLVTNRSTSKSGLPTTSCITQMSPSTTAMVRTK